MLRRSSSSRRIPNTYLRKKRKWPHSPFKTQWHYIYEQQQALQNLKQLSLSSSSSSPNSIHQQSTQNPPKSSSYLLNCLIDSFNTYNCDPTPTAYQFVIKTLSRNSQFNELNQILSHLQNVEKFETPERIFVDLIRVFGENGMVFEAIDLFFRIPDFRCVPTVNSLNSLLVILCRDKECLRVIPQLLLKSRDLNIRMEESTFSILINTLCRMGRVDFAIKMLNYIIDDGFNPDGRIYSSILSSLCQQEGVTSFEVISILEDVRKLGFCPGRMDFRNVIKFLFKQGKGKDAFGVLCEMKRDGIKPDIACYTMVLHGLVEEGEFTRVEELFDEILVFGLIPDIRTYSVYINGLCKQKKADEAYTMISCVEKLGCQPDLITYKTILESFCKVRKLNRAREVFKKMKAKGIQLNSQIYNIVIDGLISGDEVIEACNLLEEMLSKSFKPMSSTLDDIICSLCNRGLLLEALDTLEKAYAHDVVPGFRTWEALLHRLNPILALEEGLLANLVNLHVK